MTGRASSATEHGLALVAHGVPLLRAARIAGVDPRTLTRARARLGLAPLPMGRPRGATP